MSVLPLDSTFFSLTLNTFLMQVKTTVFILSPCIASVLLHIVYVFNHIHQQDVIWSQNRCFLLVRKREVRDVWK